MNSKKASREIKKLEHRIISFQARAARATVNEVKSAKDRVTKLARKLGHKTPAHLVAVLFGDHSAVSPRAAHPARKAKPARKARKPAPKATKARRKPAAAKS